MDEYASRRPLERGARDRLFRIALAASGISIARFAKGIGITREHLHAVLRGAERSPHVQRAISSLIMSARPTIHRLYLDFGFHHDQDIGGIR